MPGMQSEILRAGLGRAQKESVQELRELFGTWLELPPDFGGSGYKRLFTPSRTFWLFLSQVLTEDGTCRETLKKFLAWLKVEENKTASSKTTAYCKARGRLQEDDIQDTHREVVRNIEAQAGSKDLWLGRRVRVVDGSSVSMPDTAENQAKYPQPKGQEPGCGFPVMRIVGVFSLATGILLEVAKGSLHVHERTLFRELWDLFEKDDISLADRGFSGFADFYRLEELGGSPVMRNHQCRKKGMTEVKRLGKNDRLVEWHKTNVYNRPKWMDVEEWQEMPDRLDVREITVTVDTPGFRSKTIVIVTTLLDPKDFPASAFAELYRKRWLVELYLRDLKTTMGMEILRCKTPEMVNKELYMHLIAYNLVRAIMLDVAAACAVHMERLSLKGTIATTRQWAAALTHAAPEEQDELYQAMLHCIADDPVPDRPDRSEPRARKRRPKNYPLLNKPRKEYVEIPHRNRYKKPKS